MTNEALQPQPRLAGPLTNATMTLATCIIGTTSASRSARWHELNGIFLQHEGEEGQAMLTEMWSIERELMTTPAVDIPDVIAKLLVALKVADQIEVGSESYALISAAVMDLRWLHRLAALGLPASQPAPISV